MDIIRKFKGIVKEINGILDIIRKFKGIVEEINGILDFIRKFSGNLKIFGKILREILEEFNGNLRNFEYY